VSPFCSLFIIFQLESHILPTHLPRLA
jgi:hypothetical protein